MLSYIPCNSVAQGGERKQNEGEKKDKEELIRRHSPWLISVILGSAGGP